ncbi:MAG TPA: family 16 glycoside hydrolase [Phycisphaerae bacterium]|nr:family 16 glycoside hydrolase [Phycisphaerae bacterium]
MSVNGIAIIVIFAVLGTAAFALSNPAAPPAASPKAEWNFDKDEVGKRAADWRVRETNGTGKTGTWTVATDDSAPSSPNVLKLETQADDRTYNLLIAEKISFKDLDLRVRIKANSGKKDQGGGLIWRCKDENNYYICRINPLEGNFRVYKVEKGKRTQLESVKLETKTGQWYEVRAVMVGDTIECYVDGKKYLEAIDDTFNGTGKIGLWTKADASSSFDDVVVHEPTSALQLKKGC